MEKKQVYKIEKLDGKKTFSTIGNCNEIQLHDPREI